MCWHGRRVLKLIFPWSRDFAGCGVKNSETLVMNGIFYNDQEQDLEKLLINLPNIIYKEWIQNWIERRSLAFAVTLRHNRQVV